MARTRRLGIVVAAAACAAAVLVGGSPPTGGQKADAAPVVAAAAPGAPNIFIYNLDDLRDAFPGGIDPLQYMPKTRQWMTAGRRYTKMFVTVPSCCPSRSALMTGRYSHNNGVRLQSQGPSFDGAHSMACYLRAAGYATYEAGKFLVSWPNNASPAVLRPLHADHGWVQQRPGARRRRVESDERLFDDHARRSRSRVRHPGTRERQAVPAVRDAARAALGRTPR